MTGIELIEQERQRQIEVEGWTPEYDDGHRDGELRRAAIVYRNAAEEQVIDGKTNLDEIAAAVAYRWPWERQWLKISNEPIRNLAKAGALFLAEQQRLERVGVWPGGAQWCGRSANNVASLIDKLQAE